jgi:hypothetical protein
MSLIHNAWFWFGCYYFFSAVVSGMPSPLPNDGRKYIWAFNTLHALAGSLGRVVARQVPGVDPVQQRLDDISKGDK